jgi:DNA helicase HerA-like ATPase
MHCERLHREIRRRSKRRRRLFARTKDIDVVTVITELGVGEALVSFLNDKGQPNVVDRALIFPPQSQLPPLGAAVRSQVIKQFTVAGHYEKALDRESAYEMLQARAPQVEQPVTRQGSGWQNEAGKLLGALGTSAARAIGSQVGREIIRGALGSLFGTTTTRRRR